MTKKRTNEEEWAIFANNVAWLQKHHGLSNREMSKKLKISPSTLNKIKNGELPPRISIEIFFHIQKEFGIHPVEQLAKLLKDTGLHPTALSLEE